MTLIPVKKIPSPCRSYEALLFPGAHTLWDRSHATLRLHDLSFGERLFGWHGIWSPCSRYFAVAEWLDVDSANCPDMQLLLIDLPARRECVVEHVPCGFIEPMYFHEDAIKYTKIAAGMDRRAVLHRRMVDLTGWRPLPPAHREKNN